jgi:hypothetical protein
MEGCLAAAVYLLCALTSAACTMLLFRLFWKYRATRLVLWSSVSFACFTASNALVFSDLVIFPTADLSVARAGTACLGSAVLLLGLIWERE